MAIVSVDDIVAALVNQPARFFLKAQTTSMVAGRPVSCWPLAGVPGAGVQDVAGLNGTAWSSGTNAAPTPVNGQLPFVAAAGGLSSYVARMVAGFPNGGNFLLCDRLWSNSGMSMTSTASQAIVSPAWPARDENQSTNGVGVLLGLEITTATGAGTPTITVGYTNSAGVAGRSAINGVGVGASSPVATFYPFGLQSGDVGVRSVQSIQLSATMTSGAASLVAYRVISSLEVGTSHAGAALDPITGGLPQIFDGSVPFPMYYPSSTGVGPAFGTLTVGRK
jgi:hypothetical protein